jgi:hypothetical protein
MSKVYVFHCYITDNKFYMKGEEPDPVKYYYVSNTDNFRLETERSSWLKIHRPGSIETVESKYDIMGITYQYLCRYGLEYVRGSIIPEEIISPIEFSVITRMLRNYINLCSRCGKSGHLHQACVEEVDIFGKGLECQVGDGFHSIKSCQKLGAFTAFFPKNYREN